MPDWAPFTVAVKVHVELRAMVAFASVIVDGLVVVIVPPPQIGVGPVLCTVNPPGNVIPSPTFESGSGFATGFVNTTESVDVPFTAIVVGLNENVVITGG